MKKKKKERKKERKSDGLTHGTSSIYWNQNKPGALRGLNISAPLRFSFLALLKPLNLGPWANKLGSALWQSIVAQKHLIVNPDMNFPKPYRLLSAHKVLCGDLPRGLGTDIAIQRLKLLELLHQTLKRPQTYLRVLCWSLI